MDKRRDNTFKAILGFNLICVIIMAVVIFVQGRMLQKQQILFAYEVGIIDIIYADIISVSFDSANPNEIFDLEDVAEIDVVLNTLKTAVFKRADKPSEIFALELIYIETEKDKYAVGYIEDAFVISKNGETNYYKCSARNEFANALIKVKEKNKQTIPPIE